MVLKTKLSFSIFYQFFVHLRGCLVVCARFCITISILLHDQLRLKNAAAFGQGKLGIWLGKCQ